jgi:RpiR family transcriptional regulator, carbohydrate utilization regulator
MYSSFYFILHASNMKLHRTHCALCPRIDVVEQYVFSFFLCSSATRFIIEYLHMKSHGAGGVLRETPQIDNPLLVQNIPHQCLIRLKSIFPSLKSAELRAANVLVSQPEQIPVSNVADVAKRAGCSQATVVRLARKLRYEGFPELRADFRRREPRPAYELRVGDCSDAREIAGGIFEASIVALRDTLQLLDLDAYEKALDSLVRAERMAFIGIGNAAVVAQDAFLKFLRVGVTCFQSADPDLQIVFASTQLRKSDVLLAISYSGASRPLLNAMKQAQAVGANVILITNSPRSPLTRFADTVLLTAVFQNHVSREIAAKRIAQLCIVESLYLNYLIRKGAAPQKALSEANAALIQNKIQ